MKRHEPQSVTLEFYLDLISPFGYLCNHGLRRLAEHYPFTVRHHPVELQRIKLAAGNDGPSNRDIPPKIAYLTEDLRRWAEFYRVPIVSALPGADTTRLNKGVYFATDRGVADQYVQAAWNGIWAEGNDPGKPTSLDAVARGMGWDAQEFRRFIDSEDASARYEEDNVAAISAGVFGVPTIMIGRNMWWGNDRLNFVERHIAGCLNVKGEGAGVLVGPD
jgi:2-hydroxychromene-2-carboxylate isomerase